MAIEGIDSLTGRRTVAKGSGAERNKADDFPLFYRTRESMIIDEAILESVRDFDAGGDDEDDARYNSEESSPAVVKGKKLTEDELETIRSVVKDVDGMVEQLMSKAFRESYFTVGVLNCLLISYVFAKHPESFWVLYLVEMLFLIPVNQYHRIHAKPLNKSMYYLDYCWIMNLVAVTSLTALVVNSFAVNYISGDVTVLSSNARKHLFMAVLGTSCGPLLAATAALPYIALLFHDIDTMTGLFIHIFPPMEAYTLRWHSNEIRAAWPSVFHLDYLDEVHFFPLEGNFISKAKTMLGSIAGNTLILYSVWFLLYAAWMLYIGIDLPRKDRWIPGTSRKMIPKYDTCFHSFMRGGACIGIGEWLWKRPRGVSAKQIETNHFERRDVVIHMTYHAATTLASIFVLGYACYSSKAIHGLALIAMTAIAVSRGAQRYSYYSTAMYSRTLKKHFSILLPDVSSRAGVDEKVEEDEELVILDYLLKIQIRNMRTRIGLVPNYFITRGESIPDEKAWCLEGICRRLFSCFLKLFQPTDFRDVDSYHDFVDVVCKLGQLASRGEQTSVRAVSILNQGFDRHGNTILHLLVKKRQLKFIKPLLLHCGQHLRINRLNKRGQSALDFAIDRLEVEMVFLLRLYGATPSAGRPPNSLGYAEWISTDLIANLDTGRWLNKRSIDAIIHHVMDSDLPVEDLLAWAYGRGDALTDDVIAFLGRLPQIFAITLADGCDAITNHEAYGTLIRYLFSLHQIHNKYMDVNNLVEDEANTLPGLGNIPNPETCYDLAAFLEDRGVDVSTQTVAGRTLFFKDRTGTNQYAIKLAKSFEEKKNPHPLAKEAAMDSSMAVLKERHGLLSEYPTMSELISVKEIPLEMREAIEGSAVKGYSPFEVSQKPDGITALFYRPPRGYTQYANDPALPLEQCIDGILKAAFDYSVLARAGLFHASLIDIQHDSLSGRPHLWSFESFLTRFRGGAGRIARGFAGLSAPNVRASGLGDLKHILSKAQVIDRYDPSKIHAQHNILYDHHERFQVSLIEQLGAGLFATALLVASSWEGRHRQGIKPNMNLSEMLQRGFVSFLLGYLQVDEDRARELLSLMGANFDLMAKQIQLFVTEDYVKAAETAPRRPIFGIIAKVLGFFTHPTAFVHFAQWGGRDLSKPGYSVAEIREVYQPPDEPPDDNDGTQRLLPKGYPRIDTSMMRSSPTWVQGHGWINDKGQRHFGSYEGVLPFQALIRDLYAVTYLTSMVLLTQVSEPPTYQSDPGLGEGEE